MTTKPKFFRKLNDAVNAMGLPSATSEIAGEMEAAIEANAAYQKMTRLAERGTLDKQSAYISDAGKECDKQIWLSNTNEPATNPPDLSGEINFAMGHVAEEVFARMLAKRGYKILDEVRVEFDVGNPPVVVSGRADFILEHPTKPWLVELKTTSAEAMKWMIAKQEPGKEDHRTQINLYLHAGQQGLLPHKYERGHLVYVVKDAAKGTRNVFAFYVDYDQAKAESDLLRLAHLWRTEDEPPIPARYVNEFYEKGKLPVWPCLYCNFLERCRSEMKNAGQKGAA